MIAADLSRLIPSTYTKKGRGRIEKTEIIEMAIKHMKHLQSHVCRDKGTLACQDFNLSRLQKYFAVKWSELYLESSIPYTGNKIVLKLFLHNIFLKSIFFIKVNKTV